MTHPAHGRQGLFAGLSLSSGAAALLGFGTAAVLGAADGGYWPTALSWTGLVFGWVALVALLLGRAAPLGRLDWLFLGALCAFVAWVVLSVLWSDSVPRTMIEVQRGLGYVALVMAVLLVVRVGAQRALLSGLWAGITVVASYALATRLLPDRLGTFDPTAGYRLSEPVGYWNALGIFVVIGALIALGLAARAGALVRALSAASLVVLLPTLHFTFSRGSWIALAVGLAVVVIVDPRRLQLLTVALGLAPASAIAVRLAYDSEALTRPATSIQAAADDGHALLLPLLVLAVTNAAVALTLRRLEQRLMVPPTLRRLYGAVVIGAAIVGAVVLFSTYGSPWALAERAYDAFIAAPDTTGRDDLNERLFSFSGNGRADLWRVAWRDVEEEPVLGTGAGTYELRWLSDRPDDQKVRDAHNLYLEVLGELGIVGLVLLGLALAVPVVAAARARSGPIVPAAAAAYVAFLVHAAVDWDWEMTAVTAAALVAACVPVVSLRRRDRDRGMSFATTGIVAAVAAAICAVSFVGVIGYRHLDRAESASAEGRIAELEAEAEAARRWLRWSGEPLRYTAVAQLARGDRSGARATLRSALEKDSRDWGVWLTLAAASEGAQQREALRKVEELNPRSPQLAALRARLDGGS